MPLFISEEEFRRCSDDAGQLVEKADAFIRELYNQIETVKAEAEAASITLEQTCALNEQKYVSLSTEYSSLQLQHSEVCATLEQRTSELGHLQAEKNQLLLQSIDKDGEIERLTREALELHKSKKQLMELVERRDLEGSEKSATIKSYLDKIVNLTENAASKDAQLADLESELGQLRATSAQLLQEKELLKRHNSWLNEELTAKFDTLIQLRRENGELEADMSAKLAEVEQKFKQSSSSLTFHKDRVRELEDKLAFMERELLSTKDAAAAAEVRSSTEITTVTKLLNLYKEKSEECSKKARELEGVIKALETHLNQVESEYKEKLEKEVSLRQEVEKQVADLKEKLQSTNSELENLKKGNELKNLPLSSFTTGSWLSSVDAEETVEDVQAIVPTIPGGVSGTALAASLLRDGWTLAKIYAKYQEAVDALRHEQLGRKQSQAILERVLYEIEEKAGVIMDEREEHERFVEDYSALDQKLQQTLSERSVLENTIEELKASLKRQERDYDVAQKEIIDLQKQVAVLLKECRDVQLRCGSVARYHDDDPDNGSIVAFSTELNAENIISDRLLNLKDINGLVEQNVQLRSLVRTLSDQIDEKEAELKDKYEKELRMHTDETASKLNAVLQRAKEQADMLESLHNSVAMYKKLYEEEQKLRSYLSHAHETVAEQGSREIVPLQDSSHDTSRKVQEQAFDHVKNLEEELARSKSEVMSLRSERDKLKLEAQFAGEKLARFVKDFDHQRDEQNGVIARNVEFSQLIVDYQKKLRESADSLNAANERSSKLTMEVSILKHEKEMLQNSEKRASDEVRSLSERVHRLQASLDTIQSTEEVREEVRGVERRKQEEYINKIEREWAEAKRELQAERDNVQNLSLQRESTLKDVLRQVDDLNKELANALQSVANAESRAAVAEARCYDLEKMIESARAKEHSGAEDGPSSTEKILASFRNEIENLREEAEASKNHMLQYKSIAQVNEEALKQMELAHENFKNEADEVKRSLENELQSLRERVTELESECKLKTEEAISANAGKEEATAGALSEIARVKDYYSDKISQIATLESKITALEDDLEREHKNWRTAQDNYERQVILQSETIQELTKTSEALSSVQQEASELRQVVDVLKTDNSELKQKWETEKLAIEVYKSEADKKYSEVDELNKILHNRLEALHIKLAEKERGIASGSTSHNLADDDGLQNVVNYLRRSKEIAETEISLLKQEKFRLQSQLESALKSAESAQTSLKTERAKSRASVFSDDEFNSLQLQIRELNLLRESNVQLREENRHNFEECQRLREALQNVKGENENMEKLLRDRDNELEAYRKELENLKMEKVHLEKRIDVLVDKCKDVDIDDYNRLKESFQQMQLNLREKDAQLDEIKKLLSEKQDTVSVLERDFARTKAELNERETRINELVQSETSLKSDIDKSKRSNYLARRSMAKEKDDMSKEIQALSKQLEEAKQVKRNIGDSVGEQALREKEKEKDTRIQILERTLERHREDLKKEKEDHHKEKERSQKMRKTILDARDNVNQQKRKLSDELKKHKQALQLLQDEVQKLKNGSESTSVVQDFSGTLMEDFTSAYFQAVENFEQVTQPAYGDLDSGATNATSLDNTTCQAAASSTQIQAVPSASVPSTRTNEEKEKKVALTKANIKMGRKLVRPNIIKPKESQGDVEMSEADESNTTLPSHTTENQGNVTIPTTLSVRKRPSASFSSDMLDEMPASEETGSDVPIPLLKKPKASEGIQEGGEEPSAAPMKPSEEVAIEESSDDVAKIHHSNDKEEAVDTEKDEFETGGEQIEEPTGNEQVQVEQVSDMVDISDEKLDKPSETMLSDDQLRDQTEQDIQHIVSESGGDREEGELVADVTDNDGDSNISNEMGGPEAGEFQAEDREKSPGIGSGLDVGEIDPLQTPEEEKTGDMTEGIFEGSDQNAETEQAPGSSNVTAEEPLASTTVDIGSSEQGEPTATQDMGGTPVSPLNSGSTTINLQERARQRAHLRQAGIATSSPSRGRGRAIRGRGARGGRTGRGQSPG